MPQRAAGRVCHTDSTERGEAHVRHPRPIAPIGGNSSGGMTLPAFTRWLNSGRGAGAQSVDLDRTMRQRFITPAARSTSECFRCAQGAQTMDVPRIRGEHHQKLNPAAPLPQVLAPCHSSVRLFEHDFFFSYAHADVDGTGDAEIKTWCQKFANDVRQAWRRFPEFAALSLYLGRESSRANAWTRPPSLYAEPQACGRGEPRRPPAP